GWPTPAARAAAAGARDRWAGWAHSWPQPPMLGRCRVPGKKIIIFFLNRREADPGWGPPPPTRGTGGLLFLAPPLQIPHLVQAAFLLLRGLLHHPLPLLDQLADLLP